MSDLNVIKEIENKLQVLLKKVALEVIKKEDLNPLNTYAVNDAGKVVGLKLSFFAISLDEEISKLSNLEILALKEGRLESPEILSQFKKLTSLSLSDTELTDISVLKELKGLTSLNLSGPEITDISAIEELKGLTSLTLRGTKLTDISALKELKGLTSLILWDSEITDISALKKLKKIAFLSLSKTKLTDISVLKELKELTSLSLWDTELTDISVLRELKELTKLNLSGPEITDISTLKELKELTSLSLWDTELSDISMLRELKGLTSLSLWKSEVSDISMLKELKELTSLNLSGTEIIDISVLKELKELTKLNLSSTELTHISVLKELKKLTSLTLNNTEITDISVLKELKRLTSLNLASTEITDISVLKELKELTSLSLRDTEITDISVLKELKELTKLNLRGTKLTDISVLKELKELTSLNLAITEITDISVIKELKELNYLNLRGNKITDISVLKELKELESLNLSETSVTDLSVVMDLSNLRMIFLFKLKTLENPPKEIAAKGPSAIRNYFRQKVSQGSARLYEAKALIVGEPGAGKTSLRKKLVNPGYNIISSEGGSTLGIEVEKDWEFPFCNDENITFRTSLWDFGGQDIQYMIHQYFLTGKSLYIIVADERKQNTHYDYWFNVINLLGEGSPVLVVLNKRDGVAITNYDHSEICRAFPELTIEQFELDMAKEEAAFNALRKKIEKMFCNLEHVGDTLPAKWPVIRGELEKQKDDDHISLEEYLALCREKEIEKEEDAMNLAGYLYALGTILHFKDDPSLRDLIILNPNWIVDALYAALSDKKIKTDCGHFTRDWLFDLWQNPTRKDKRKYSEEECYQLLSLMSKEKFELCYELDEGGKYISPQLLPESAPKYDVCFSGSLNFRFRYAFMPEGIISRLIVRLNHLLYDNIDSQIVWRYGAIFERKGCFAEVIQTRYSNKGHREINVQVSGPDYRKKELMTIISNEIEAIHRKSFKHIHYDVLIPCNSEKCTISNSPKLFPLDDLNKLSGYGDKNMRCSKCGEMIDIYGLVEGMVPDEVRKSRPLQIMLGDMEYNDFSKDIVIDRMPYMRELTGDGISMSKILYELLSIMKTQAANPAKIEIKNEINIEIHNEIKGIACSLDLMKEDLEIDVPDETLRLQVKKELELVEKAAESVSKMSKEDAKDSSNMKRLDNFIMKMEDTNSRVGKLITAMDSGVGYAQDLAGYYNKIADWCGMPHVPSIFLKK